MVKKKKAAFLTSEWGGPTNPDGVSTPKTGWLLSGNPLPENPAGWFVYRPCELSPWYLIEGQSGLSVGQASTIADAVDAFVSHPSRVSNWQEAVARRKPVAELPRKPVEG